LWKSRRTISCCNHFCIYYGSWLAHFVLWRERKGRTNSKLDSEVNVIFDFDICFPARPYALDFSATECFAAARDSTTSSGKVDNSLDFKMFEGKKGIPKREEAAFNLNIQIVQRTDRASEWVAVDDVIYPLRYTIEKDDEETKMKCESARLEVRMRGKKIHVSSLIVSS